MNERESFLAMLDKLQLEYKILTEPEYMDKQGLSLGAVETVCVRNEIDVMFDKDGNCVGHHTTSYSSFRRIKRGVC